jgi:predicted nucleic acid-binding Zn finger protein
MKKLIVSRYNIESTSTNRTWVVAEYDDGSYSCSCPAWIFHKGTKINCKHINELIEKKNTPTKESTLTITGLTPNQAEVVYQKALELTKQDEGFKIC